MLSRGSPSSCPTLPEEQALPSSSVCGGGGCQVCPSNFVPGLGQWGGRQLCVLAQTEGQMPSLPTRASTFTHHWEQSH